jgi:hypothetical protein
MKVLFINNDGGGFADYIEVEAGTTVRAAPGMHMQERNHEHFADAFQGQYFLAEEVHLHSEEAWRFKNSSHVPLCRTEPTCCVC